MSAFMAFLIYTALHVPVIVAEYNTNKINPPILQVVGGKDLNHPIVKIASDQPNAEEFELEYLLYGVDVPFLTKSLDSNFEVIPGVAPCRVRGRFKIDELVSPWSKPIKIEWLETDRILDEIYQVQKY